MLDKLVQWSEELAPSRIPSSLRLRRQRAHYLGAVLYSFVGYQIPALIAFIGVALGNDTYGYKPFVLLYIAFTLACFAVYSFVLRSPNFTGGAVVAMTLSQLGFWLIELTLFIFYMDHLRPVVLLCTLLAINHLIIVGEMLACLALIVLTVVIYLAVTTYAVQVAGQPIDIPMETVTIFGFVSISLYLSYMGVQLRKSRDRLHKLKGDLESTQKSLKASMGQLEKAALTDVLTGLWNRRAARSFLAEAHKAVVLGQEKATLLLLDIDRFKSVNDTYGHDCGDLVLKQTAKTFMNFARGEDLAARWGGEEFLLLFRDTELHQAQKIAERLRAEINQIEFGHQGANFSITFSGGLVELSADKSPEKTVASADELLYAAKDRGRNRILSDL